MAGRRVSAASLFSAFYIVSALAFCGLLAVYGFNQPHLAFLLVMSLAIAYAILRKKRWSLGLLVVYTPSALVFSGLTLYSAVCLKLYRITEGLLLIAAVSVYAVLVLAALVYVAVEKPFEG